MPLLNKNRVQIGRDKKFLLLRILGILSFLLFIFVVGLTGQFMYKNIYVEKNNIQKLLNLQSTGLPHTVQFERLEKVEEAWKTKLETKAPTSVRNPFVQGALNTDTANKKTL